MYDPVKLRESLKTSIDDDYSIGQISVFPESIDTEHTLYRVSNNAETRTTQAVNYNDKNIFVEDASGFPATGLLRIGPPPGEALPGEIVYYARRTNRGFSHLVRGAVGTRQNRWEKGSYVTCFVLAEHHNAVKDAIYNVEKFLGTKYNPETDSFHARLKKLEFKHLSPKPKFRAYPVSGPPSLRVRFQNFSGPNFVTFLWDFGDGTQSTERSPEHIYTQIRNYTVKLHSVTEDGAQGIITKNDYIRVTDEEVDPFYYIEHLAGLEYQFVDQTDGDIIQRQWQFGDGTNQLVTNPNIHTWNYTYGAPGEYITSLLIVFVDQTTVRYSVNLTVV